jgi:hypothetical protein
MKPGSSSKVFSVRVSTIRSSVLQVKWLKIFIDKSQGESLFALHNEIKSFSASKLKKSISNDDKYYQEIKWKNIREYFN